MVQDRIGGGGDAPAPYHTGTYDGGDETAERGKPLGSRRALRSAPTEERAHGGRAHEPVIRPHGQTDRHGQHEGALHEPRERHGGEQARDPDRQRQVDEANLAKIPVTYMAGEADLMRIHHTAVWRVCHKRAFLLA